MIQEQLPAIVPSFVAILALLYLIRNEGPKVIATLLLAVEIVSIFWGFTLSIQNSRAQRKLRQAREQRIEKLKERIIDILGDDRLTFDEILESLFMVGPQEATEALQELVVNDGTVTERFSSLSEVSSGIPRRSFTTAIFSSSSREAAIPFKSQWSDQDHGLATLFKPMHFRLGDRLRVKFGETATMILVQLITEGHRRDEPFGIIRSPLHVERPNVDVMSSVVAELALDGDYDRVGQIAVYGGKHQFGIDLGNSNGPAYLLGAELNPR